MSSQPDLSAAAANVARQPIYDRALEVHAYELVFGGGDGALGEDEVAAVTAGRGTLDPRVVAVEVEGLSQDELAERVWAFSGAGAKLLARGVADYAQYEICRGLGFDYFQGPFFLRPKALDRDGVPSGALSRIQLVAALQDQGVPFEELERLIAGDVGLAYRLLRTINSGFFMLPNRVSSIHDALVLLGQRNVRSWATLVLLGEVDDRPSELLVMAMVRARLCELVAEARGAAPESFFTVGLFSVIDAFVGAPLERILADLPLAGELVAALLRREGELGRTLAGVVAYEDGRFDAADALLGEVPVRELYLEALRFADEAGESLAGGLR